MSGWRIGDFAVCVAPCGTLETGCIYVVSGVPGPGLLRRDGMTGEGLTIRGHIAPDGLSGFDARRFLRAETPKGQTDTVKGTDRP